MADHIELSRRSFLAGTGIVAASAAALSLSGCGEGKSRNAEGVNDIYQESVENWMGTDIDITDDDIEEELSADVVIVGMGDSGVVAFRAAAEEGVTVIGVEKSSSINSCGEDIALMPGSKQQKAWGRDELVPKEVMVERHMEECCQQSKYGIMERYANEQGEFFDWFIEPNDALYIAETYDEKVTEEQQEDCLIPTYWPIPNGYEWEEEEFPTYPVTVNFSNLKATLTANYQTALDTGLAQALFGVFAEQLIMEDGRCTGVYVRNSETEMYKKITANKGVILATGDYSSNTTMLKRFAPETIENDIQTVFQNLDVEGNKVNTGDGQKMGVRAGARIQQHHAPMIHNMGGGADISGKGVMGIDGFLQLNLDGKRFMNEDIPGQQLENQIEHLRGRCSYQFFDANWPDQIKAYPAGHGEVVYYYDENPNDAIAMNARSNETVATAIEEGRCFTGDTIDELLAQLTDIDADEAKKSIERYNELCHAGEDTDFNKIASRMLPLEEAPFYACKIEQAIMLVCIGGLESDEYCHTFDEDRNVIAGLYACGNCQGDRFAVTYPISLKGLSVGMATFYGYVAGKSAANEI